MKTIISPINGRLVPLSEVPDETFSQKILGDGVAVIPKDGKIVSPVNGTLVSVANTSHAFSFLSDDGLNVLVHVGLETISLNGKGWRARCGSGFIFSER